MQRSSSSPQSSSAKPQSGSLNWLSLIAAAHALRRGECSSVDIVRACLDRIEQREPIINAWVKVDAEGALDMAAHCDALAHQNQWRGPLHGIPIGIKDIFDVSAMPTAYGSDAWPVAFPGNDAASVARLRAAGAIILGKTVTTAFAMGDPGPTRNPWNPAHTPGGSSSGSAAAVADGMCFAALGTQTVGSVIRPCSFNGLAGFKPGYGRIDINGVQALAWGLDHVGALTRSVPDAALLWQVLRNDVPTPPSLVPLPSIEAGVHAHAIAPMHPARLWRFREMFDDHASAAMRAAVEQHCDALSASGMQIVERALPVPLASVLDNHQIIMAAQAAAVHGEPFARYGGAAYPPRIRALIEAGQAISATEYLAARRHQRHTMDTFCRQLRDVDGAIMPAATGAAPLGLEHTGERHMNTLASYLGVPAVCYRVAVDADNLPLGVQLLSNDSSEDRLLMLAQHCESIAGASWSEARVSG